MVSAARSSVWVRMAVSTLVAAGVLWWTITGMQAQLSEAHPGVRLREAMAQAIRGVPWSAVLVYSLGFLALHLVRVVRWLAQLRPLGLTDERFGWSASLVGLAATAFLPLRLGELVRPAWLARGGEVSVAAALGTTVLERVVDGLLVTLVFFGAVVMAPGAVPLFIETAGYVSLAVFAGVGGAIVLAARRPSTLSWVLRTLGRVSPSIAARLSTLMTEFLSGASELKGAGAWPRYIAWTFVYWGLNGVTTWYWLRAFGFELPWYAGFGIVATLVVGIMLPSGPGFLGNFQVFLMAGVAMWLRAPLEADAAAAAFACALTMNGLQLFVQGGAALVGAGGRIVDSRKKNRSSRDPS